MQDIEKFSERLEVKVTKRQKEKVTDKIYKLRKSQGYIIRFLLDNFLEEVK